MALLCRDPRRHAASQGRSDLTKNAGVGSRCQSFIDTKCRLIAGEWRLPLPLALSASQSLITRKCYQREVPQSQTMGFLYCCKPPGSSERKRARQRERVFLQKALLHTDSTLYGGIVYRMFFLRWFLRKLYNIKHKSTKQSKQAIFQF